VVGRTTGWWAVTGPIGCCGRDCSSRAGSGWTCGERGVGCGRAGAGADGRAPACGSGRRSPRSGSRSRTPAGLEEPAGELVAHRADGRCGGLGVGDQPGGVLLGRGDPLPGGLRRRPIALLSTRAASCRRARWAMSKSSSTLARRACDSASSRATFSCALATSSSARICALLAICSAACRASAIMRSTSAWPAACRSCIARSSAAVCSRSAWASCAADRRISAASSSASRSMCWMRSLMFSKVVGPEDAALRRSESISPCSAESWPARSDERLIAASRSARATWMSASRRSIVSATWCRS
jgi:hypothetical protein